MREQTAHALPVGRREDSSGGGDCGNGGPTQGVLDCQQVNAPFTRALIFVVTFARSRRNGPPEEVVKPSEGLKGSFLVMTAIGNLGGSCVVLAGGSERVVVPFVGYDLERGFHNRAGGVLHRGTVVSGRALVKWPTEWVVETTGQTDIVPLCPCRGEAGYAEGK